MSEKKSSRRDFLKNSAAAGLTALVSGAAIADGKATAEDFKEGKKAILMDNSLCVECQACRVACQNEYEIDIEYSFIKFNSIEKGEYPNVAYHLRRNSCMHCPDAPCIAVCPVDALSESEEGFTVIDAETCIACGRCLDICPFDVPEIGSERMYKCDLCQHRIKDGKDPACVDTCIAYALDYGDYEEMLEKGNDRVEKLKEDHPDANLYTVDYKEDDFGLLLILKTDPQELDLVDTRRR